jgi:hypothetical protein
VTPPRPRDPSEAEFNALVMEEQHFADDEAGGR